MLRIGNRLFLALALLMFQPVSYAQLRELGGGAPGPVKAQHLTAELISDSGAVAPGSASRVALLLTLEPGWHVYWVYAGDSGEPPRVTWSLPPGVTVGPMRYPAPSRLPLGPLMDYGYEGTAVFPFDLSALQQLPLGNTKLKAHVQWLVCREVCFPGKAFLGLDLDVVSKAPDAANKLIAAAVQAEPAETPDSVRVEVNATRNLLTLHVITGRSERSAEYYPLDDGSIRDAADQHITPNADGVTLVTERADISDILPKELKGVLKLSGRRSYSFDVPVTPPKIETSSNSEPGLLVAVLLALAGGVILNLMPCVFPVLFLKVLALVGSVGESRDRARPKSC